MNELEDIKLQNMELYEATRSMSDSLTQLLRGIDSLNEKYTAPKDEVKVSGEVSVTNQSEVDLQPVVDALQAFADTITKTIEKNAYKPSKSVTIDNIDKARVDSVKVSNLSVLENAILDLKSALSNIEPQVIVQKEDLPYTARKPLAVRLSDGKKFYNAIATFSESVNKLPLVQTENGLALAVANSDGSPISGGGTVSNVYGSAIYGTSTYA